jgi:hypothetical protein
MRDQEIQETDAIPISPVRPLAVSCVAYSSLIASVSDDCVSDAVNG